MITTTHASPALGPTDQAGRLWYDRPAERWFEALPIGNGRLGGMIYGGAATESIRLSESTAWSGAPSTDDLSPTARKNLPAIRAHLLAGRHAEAQKLAREHLLGRMGSFGTNVPLPEVRLDFTEVKGISDHYQRALDLDTGIVTVECGDITRETFASNPHGIIAMRITCRRRHAIGFTVSLADLVVPGRTEATEVGVAFTGHAFETMHSNGGQGTALEIRIRIETDHGNVQAVGSAVEIAAADTAVVLIAVGTDWNGADSVAEAEDRIARAARLGYSSLREAHINDHQGMMRRVSLDLGGTSRWSTLPTDLRRTRFARGDRDDDLIALFFQYGRYLTLAGSRANSPLPLALQGIWNDGLASGSSWTNDFHLDMNTQQNYWAAEPTNLAECQQPLFRFIHELAESGHATSARMYGMPGWVAHTVTNAWGYTAPGTSMGWGINVTGGTWLALQLWEHYAYNPDEGFLRARVFPIFRDAALFFLAYLVREPEHGWLVAGPAESPENWYIAPDGTRCSIAMGNTVDRVFAEAALRICAEAAELLGVDQELRDRIAVARSQLSPFQIGRHGQLREWLHDYDEADPAHRHTSHLCALFPERQISPRATPELASAADVTIERRRNAPGWEQTEWVEANFAIYYARLLNGDKALVHVTSLIADAAEANLLTYSAGGVAGAAENIYSFDGNAGGTAAVAEMLLQSDGEEIELLPALPSSWLNGAIRGLRARGGFTVDIGWREGRLDQARIRPTTESATTVRYGNDAMEVSFTAGHDVVIRVS